MTATFLVYDIETIPETELAEAWRNSAEYEKDRKFQNLPEGAEPFPPTSCHKVVSIAAMVMDENFHVLKSGVLAGGAGGAVEDNERAQVERWNEIVSTSNPKGPLTIIDWNGRRFDAPVLQFRAFRYGIPMPWYFGKIPDQKGQISSWSKTYRDRYGGRHLDLVDEWTNKGAFSKCHMKDLATLMGLPGKVGIDGSKVYDAWKEGRRQEIDNYCVEDVWQTGFIALRMFFLEGKLGREAYIAATQLLITHVTGVEGHADFVAGIDEDRLLLK